MNPCIFSRQSRKTGYGAVKATSINQVELEKANWEGKKLVEFEKCLLLKPSASHLQGQLEASPRVIHLVDFVTKYK
jgi:hypothetical protein